MTQLNTNDKPQDFSNEIQALQIHLGLDNEDLRVIEEHDNSYKFGEEEYLILTDDEAEKKCNEYIWDTLWAFKPEFLANYMPLEVEHIKKIQELCEDANPILLKLVDNKGGLERDAKASDGRGHFLSGYDGHEEEVKVNDNYYYIFRTN